jgi:hypothetical protein
MKNLKIKRIIGMMKSNQFTDYYYLNELSDAAINKAIDKFVKQGNDKEDVIKMVNQFNDLSLRNKIQKVDIFSLSFDALRDLVNKSSSIQSRSEKEKVVRDKETEFVFENDKVIVISPKTHQSSCKYGSNTKWCTTMKDDAHWNDYWKKGIKLYYILPKDNSGKVAIAVYPNPNSNIYEVFDEQDKNITRKYDEILNKFSIPKEIIKNEVSIVDLIIQRNNLIKNPDGTYDAEGNVDISELNLNKIPIKFNKVGGDFHCGFNELTSLEGVPKEVGGDFNCSSNELTSLKGAPEKVGKNFYCNINKLTSLEEAPKEVGGDFNCSSNELTSLEGAPKEVGGDFNCNSNKLTSLEGAPKEVDRDFYCSNNKLTSLEGAPKEVDRDFYCRNNSKKFTINDVKRVSNVKGTIYL